MEPTSRVFKDIILISLIFLGLICQVQAFTSDSLKIEVQPSGDAFITFDYTLNTLEKIAVFLKIADPNNELKKALESNFHHSVSVESVSDNSAKFLVKSFAKLNNLNGEMEIVTPEVSFKQAEEILNKYWFAPLVEADFSPKITQVIFPDGSNETFNDQISIPSINHINK